MKKITCILTTAILLINNYAFSQVAKVYICLNGTISFFSETPVENIDATSLTLNCILNTSTNEINYLVDIASFKFKKPLMQEHFNEKYMESDKYPRATFKGKINEQIDWSKDGVYPITATGNLNIHNVEKPYTEKGTLTIKDGQFTFEGSFNVKTADHDIEVPTIVITNIAEVINVKHKCTLVPYIPKK
ncbi:MAG: YceI family protein [Bacteroidia bacterium]